ncbi:MAG: branched-chain amino acid ABC transporter permease [Christensenellales bacterium]|jgi:branched-chain amino acid transport system permease protein
MQNTLQQKPACGIRRALKHPFAGFILIGLMLLSMQVLSILGVGFVKSSMLNGFASVMVYAMVGYGFTFLLGYAGLASLGTAGFVGLGAYIAGYFIRQQPQVPYLVVILTAVLVSVVLGIAVGFISLRIEGIFLAIVTLGLSEIFYQIFNNWLDFTNGSMGSSISKYPIFQFFQNCNNWLASINASWFEAVSKVPFLQAIFDMKTLDARRAFYILLVVITVVLMMLTYNLGKSSTGRAMLAMKNSSSAAQAMGISLLKYRLLAFLISTIFTGFAGAMFMSYFKFSTPTNYTIIFSLNILAAVLIGGSKNLVGTFFGCLIVFGLTPIFLQDIPFFRDNSWIINVLIGSIIILIVMFYPGGLVQLGQRIKQAFHRLTAKRRLYVYGEED